MTIPFFSIIMPTHQRSQLLRRALASLRASTCQDFEVIVVSDVNDGKTCEVVTELLTEQDTFIKRTGSHGPAASRNLGLDLARGQRILFLDDDDALLPEFLSAIVGLSTNNPKAAIYTNFRIIEENREHPGMASEASDHSVTGIALESAYVKNFIQGPSIIYPANAIRWRRQDPRMSSGEDWDFILNVMSEVEFVHENITGPVIYKDYENPESRLGLRNMTLGYRLVVDYLTIYSKWPAPTQELKAMRQNLIASLGLQLPINCF